MRIQDDKLLLNFVIDCDDSQYTLRDVCTVQSGEKKGSTYEQTLGYFVDFNALLKTIAKLKTVRSEEIVGLEEFRRRYLKNLQELLGISDELLNKKV